MVWSKLCGLIIISKYYVTCVHPHNIWMNTINIHWCIGDVMQGGKWDKSCMITWTCIWLDCLTWLLGGCVKWWIYMLKCCDTMLFWLSNAMLLPWHVCYPWIIEWGCHDIWMLGFWDDMSCCVFCTLVCVCVCVSVSLE